MCKILSNNSNSKCCIAGMFGNFIPSATVRNTNTDILGKVLSSSSPPPSLNFIIINQPVQSNGRDTTDKVDVAS